MNFPDINPIALELGPIKIHWYAVTYLAAFAFAWLLGNYRADKENSGWTREQVSDLLFYGYLGVILGGRIGYVLFYNFSAFVDDPIYLFRIWDGGMSFHGGILGVTFACWWFAKNTGKAFFDVGDFVVPLVPLGLGAGRIGNFINGELWGRAAPVDLPWAFRFPRDSQQLLRHPSQLYEFFLEGVVLFIIVWWFSSKPRPQKAVAGLFILGYGCFRFIVEFYRQPDAHLGEIISWLTMGQVLSAPMIILGIIMLVMAYKKNNASQ
jgi:phosphatidylglycerol:prolipoprotein diacylglycerol transferase